MVLSATCASPPRVYSMLAQSSPMAAMAALTLAFWGIVDRVGRAVGADGRDHVIGEEPRVGAHRHALASAPRRRRRASVSRAKCSLPR